MGHTDGGVAPAADLGPGDMWICAGVCPDWALEPNNVPAQATPETDAVNLGNLAICPSHDIDFFKVIASHKGTLVATVTNGPCGPPVVVDIFGADGTTVVGASTSTAGGAQAQAAVDARALRYVRVQAATGGGENLYALVIAIQ